MYIFGSKAHNDRSSESKDRSSQTGNLFQRTRTQQFLESKPTSSSSRSGNNMFNINNTSMNSKTGWNTNVFADQSIGNNMFGRQRNAENTFLEPQQGSLFRNNAQGRSVQSNLFGLGFKVSDRDSVNDARQKGSTDQVKAIETSQLKERNRRPNMFQQQQVNQRRGLQKEMKQKEKQLSRGPNGKKKHSEEQIEALLGEFDIMTEKYDLLQEERLVIDERHKRELAKMENEMMKEHEKAGALEEEVKRLQDMLRNENRKDKKFNYLLKKENSEQWQKLYGWAQKFNLFVEEAMVKVPKIEGRLEGLMLKSEVEITKLLMEKLTELPKAITWELREVERQKDEELGQLKNTIRKVVELLEEEKKVFEEAKLTLAESTIAKMVEPLKSDITRTEEDLEEIKRLRELSSQFLGIEGEKIEVLEDIV